MLTSPALKIRIGQSKDLEDGELPESPKGIKKPVLGQFDDGYDENYLGNAADRARLASLTELEREFELFERSVRREELRYKWGIKCGIMAKEKQVDSGQNKLEPIKSSGCVRRMAPAAEKRRNAIDRLVARRQVKRQKGEECNELELESTNDSSKKAKLKARDIYSDFSSEETGEDEEARDKCSSSSEPNTPITCLMELSKALLTRNQLEDFLDKPMFEQIVIGCFVRIAIGTAPAQLSTVYRLSLIVAVEQSEQEYQMGGRRTKRVLQLQHGGQRRSFQMHLVSNQAVTSGEFHFWLDACGRDAQALPTLCGIAQKQRDIQRTTNYPNNGGDVELQTTGRQVGKQPVSSVYRKVFLIMERDIAVDRNDLEKSSQLEQEIKQIDQQAQKLEKRGQNTSSSFVPTETLQKPPGKPPAKNFDWQQYMRRKIAVLERLQSEQQKEPPVAAVEQPSVNPAPLSQMPAAAAEPQSKPKAPIDVDKLDLFELHNFEIHLDMSKLCE